MEKHKFGILKKTNRCLRSHILFPILSSFMSTVKELVTV